MSEHYEVGVETADGVEYEEFASEGVARRAFSREADKVQPGARVTLTRVTLLDAADGPP
jgi:hypothetical protein